MKGSLRLRFLLALSLATFGSAEELRFGAWSIEWLGVPNNRSGIAHGIAQDPADIADYIGNAHIDILSLEEISDDDEDDDTRTNSMLMQAFDLLNTKAGQDWTYVIFPKKNPNDTNQCVGVAWNRAKVKMAGDPVRLTLVDDPGDDFHVWDRHPHAVKFSAGPGKTDLVLVPLHMKSNVGGAAKTRPQRRLEAQLLTGQLTAIRQHFADDDIVLLGDTNILRGNEPAAATYVSAGFKDLNAGDTPTTWKGPVPFDRIYVTASQGEFTASTQSVLVPADPVEHKRRPSDHFMVVTSIEVRADDDTVSMPPGSTTVGGTPTAPTPGSTGILKIVRLLPNPVGNDTQDESATLRNAGSTPVNLLGWRLEDKAGQTWSLDSLDQTGAGSETTIRRQGQPMALNNNGDTVRLLDPSGSVVHQVSYLAAEDGLEIPFP